MTRIGILSLIVLLLVGCGNPPLPTPDIVATEVAQAQAVAATLTALVPTATPTSTPTPTSASTPTPTPSPTATLTPTPAIDYASIIEDALSQVARDPDEEGSGTLWQSGLAWTVLCTSDRIQDLQHLEWAVACNDPAGDVWTVSFSGVFETATASGRQTSVIEGMRYLLDMEAWAVQIDPESYGAQCLEALSVSIGGLPGFYPYQGEQWQLPQGLRPSKPGSNYYGFLVTKTVETPAMSPDAGDASTPTAAPTATPLRKPTSTPKPTAKPTRVPTATPAMQLLADSLADFSNGQGQNSWEFLFAARDTFDWRQMGFDGSCYKSSEPQGHICADQGAPDGKNDIAWLYKAESSGKLLFKVTAHKVNAEGDDIDIGVYRHTNKLYEWSLNAGDTTGFTKQFELDVNGGEMFFFTMHISSTWREFKYDPNAFQVQVYLKQ